MRHEALRGLVLVLAGLAGGGGGCDDGPAVPFKHQSGQQRGSYQGKAADPGGEAAQVGHPLQPGAVAGQSFGPGTTAAELAGHKLSLSEGQQIRAALALGSGAEAELLLVTQASDGSGLALQTAHGAASGWGAPTPAADLLPAGDPCR